MNYKKKSNEELLEKKKKLNEIIKEYEKMIVTVRSQIYCLYMMCRVKHFKEEIENIDTELASRTSS